MKRTVDLTINGDFQNNYHSVRNAFDEDPYLIAAEIQELLDTGSVREIKSIDDMQGTPPLIYLGTVKSIRKSKQLDSLYTPTYRCDCCGKILKFNLFKDTLCLDCNVNLEDVLVSSKLKTFTQNVPQDWLALRMRKLNY